ncbi:substrate-binding periplasmic protein [Ferruginivarius sediminum]|nr:ABC transporter substrate-binding protein [Ferruginivarius sediminum]
MSRSKRLAHRVSPHVYALFLATASAVMAACGLAYADERYSGHATVRLVTGNDYAPFTGSDLPGGGMITDIVREVFQLLGREVDVSFRPWKRGYRETLAGKYVATFPYVRTAERTADFLYSEPVLRTAMRPFVKAGSALDADSLKDPAGLRYCYPLGYELTDTAAAKTLIGSLERETPATMTRCFELLAHGRVDFVLTEPIQARITKKRLQTPIDLKAIDLVVDKTTLHVIFPRRHQESAAALRRFNKALRRLKATPRYNAIMERHLP